jgi:hypothetical protein
MPTPFDDVRELMFESVLERMGKHMSWTSSMDGQIRKGKVLYREPSDEERLLDKEYYPDVFYIEFKDSEFRGLDDAVDEGHSEVVTIEGKEYWVRWCIKLWDGFNHKARLELKK